MGKPIIVGYDPQTSDRAPVDFAVAATGRCAPCCWEASHAAWPPMPGAR
jgi:hypothetical protein